MKQSWTYRDVECQIVDIINASEQKVGGRAPQDKTVSVYVNNKYCEFLSPGPVPLQFVSSAIAKDVEDWIDARLDTGRVIP